MVIKPLTKRQPYWRDPVTAAAECEGSLVDYAKTPQLTAKQLYMWKTRLTALGHLPMASCANRSGFVSVASATTVSNTSKASLILPNGLRLEVQGELNRHLLRELIAAASESG